VSHAVQCGNLDTNLAFGVVPRKTTETGALVPWKESKAQVKQDFGWATECV
jgi:hypothetical protein